MVGIIYPPSSLQNLGIGWIAAPVPTALRQRLEGKKWPDPFLIFLLQVLQNVVKYFLKSHIDFHIHINDFFEIQNIFFEFIVLKKIICDFINELVRLCSRKEVAPPSSLLMFGVFIICDFVKIINF